MKITRSSRLIVNENSLTVTIPTECQVCHRLFYPIVNNMKYCSPHCSHQSRLEWRQQRHKKLNGKRIPKKCEYCGKRFISDRSNRKYCSPECSSKAHQDQKNKWWFENYEDNRLPLGESNLSEHRYEDFEREFWEEKKKKRRLLGRR